MALRKLARPNKKWKNNKLAALNEIHLLYGALRTNSVIVIT